MMTYFYKFYARYIYIIGFFGNSVPLFQAYKIFISLSAVNVSLVCYIIYCWSVISWMICGVLKKDKI